MDHLKMQGQLRIILALGEQSRLGVNMTAYGSLVTEGEAASLLRVSITSVRRWRREGRGPVYRKMGRSVRYRTDDLADFIASARCMETGWRARRLAA
jgi:excisionase family DNA binding protein